MHRLFEKASGLTGRVIGAAVEVHRVLGPGLLEKIYETCLIHELRLQGIGSMNQRQVQVIYKDLIFTEELRFDVLVEECLLVEVKAVQHVLPVHKAQLLSYMKLLDIPLGLLINFHEMKLVEGVSRVILPGANRSDE
jgi:GxxExxY protein